MRFPSSGLHTNKHTTTAMQQKIDSSQKKEEKKSAMKTNKPTTVIVVVQMRYRCVNGWGWGKSDVARKGTSRGGPGEHRVEVHVTAHFHDPPRHSVELLPPLPPLLSGDGLGSALDRCDTEALQVGVTLRRGLSTRCVRVHHTR
jgi:hypothetical protein